MAFNNIYNDANAAVEHALTWTPGFESPTSLLRPLNVVSGYKTTLHLRKGTERKIAATLL